MHATPFAAAAFLIALVVAWGVDQLAGTQAPALVFLLGVMLVALRAPRLVTIVHAIASFAAYDFLFVDPRGSLTIARPQEVLAFAVFAAVALIAGQQARRRLALARELAEERETAMNERLRAALLASVSHDLRSPLAAMIGAASTLQGYGAAVSAADREELLAALLGECRRLDRYVGNLLDMARLGGGSIRVERDWVAIEDLVGSAVRRARALADGKEVTLEVAPDLPLIHVHPALVEQALFNVLENAVRHAQSFVAVAVGAEPGWLVVHVADDGPGVPAAERERVFEAFHSTVAGDRGGGGTGLGLAICRGFFGAHGGDVAFIAPPHGAGAQVRLRLPLSAEPAGDGS